jgi:hypothetical protein
MPALTEVEARDAAHQFIVRRGNWADHERGVIAVFCIVFIVSVGLIAIFVGRALHKRKAIRGQQV